MTSYAYFFGEKLGLTLDDRLAILYPPSTNFGHAIGLLVSCIFDSLGIWSSITYGSVAILPTYRKNPQQELEYLSLEKPTLILSDVAGFKRLLEFEGFDKFNLSSIKRGVIGIPLHLGSLTLSVDSVDRHDPDLCQTIVKKFNLKELYSLAPTEGVLFNETAGGQGTLLPQLQVSLACAI